MTSPPPASAPSATNSGERAGSVSARSRIETISSSCEHTSQPRRRPKAAREQRHMQRIDQRRPQEFQRVGRAHQREQPDGAEIDAGFAHPDQQRRSRQRQRQPGGKAEQQHDQHAALQINRQAVAPGGAGGSVGCRRDGGLGRLRGHWSCRSASRIRAAMPLLPAALALAKPCHSRYPDGGSFHCLKQLTRHDLGCLPTETGPDIPPAPFPHGGRAARPFAPPRPRGLRS